MLISKSDHAKKPNNNKQKTIHFVGKVMQAGKKTITRQYQTVQ